MELTRQVKTGCSKIHFPFLCELLLKASAAGLTVRCEESPSGQMAVIYLTPAPCDPPMLTHDFHAAASTVAVWWQGFKDGFYAMKHTIDKNQC